MVNDDYDSDTKANHAQFWFCFRFYSDNIKLDDAGARNEQYCCS